MDFSYRILLFYIFLKDFFGIFWLEGGLFGLDNWGWTIIWVGQLVGGRIFWLEDHVGWTIGVGGSFGLEDYFGVG